MQLGVLSSNIYSNSAQDLKSILQYLQNLSEAQRLLLSEVCTLASLVIVMPATNAASKRSFSSLRRLKSYLRSTMTQTRLNNLMVLHVHSNLTDKLSLTEVGNEFIQDSTHRETICDLICKKPDIIAYLIFRVIPLLIIQATVAS